MRVEKGITKTDQPEKKRRISNKTEEEKGRLKTMRCQENDDLEKVTAIYSTITSVDGRCH